MAQLADEFDWNAAPPRVVQEGDEEDDEDEMATGEEAGADDAAGVGEESMEAEAPRGAKASTGGAATAAGAAGSSAAGGGGAKGGKGGSVFGALQTLAERAQGQRAPKRGKKLPKAPKKKVGVDEEEKYNPQLNRGIRKRQQADKKKLRREVTRSIAPFLEAQD